MAIRQIAEDCRLGFHGDSRENESIGSKESIETEYKFWLHLTLSISTGNNDLDGAVCWRERTLKILVIARECACKLKFEMQVVTKQE